MVAEAASGVVSIPGDGGEGTGAVDGCTCVAAAAAAGVEDPGEAGPVMVLDPASVGHPFSHLNPVYRYPFHSISKQWRECLNLLFFTLPLGTNFPVCFRIRTRHRNRKFKVYRTTSIRIRPRRDSLRIRILDFTPVKKD